MDPATETPCANCHYLVSPAESIAGSCPNCAKPYREQPSPLHSEMAMRNMPAPGEGDMGGNPLQEGILADAGWQNRQKRDESFASVRHADSRDWLNDNTDFELQHVVLPEGPLAPDLEDAVDDIIADPRKKTAMDSDLSIDSLGAKPDDPEKVDQKEKNDGDNHEWQKDTEVNGIGGTAHAGIPEDSPALDAVEMLLPLIAKYADSDENGLESNPLLAALHQLLEQHHPGYMDHKDDEAANHVIMGITSGGAPDQPQDQPSHDEPGDEPVADPKESTRKHAILPALAVGAGMMAGRALLGRGIGSLMGRAALGGLLGGGGGGGQQGPTSVGPVADPNIQAAQQNQMTAGIPNPGHVPNPAQQFGMPGVQIGERTCPGCNAVIPEGGTGCPQCGAGAIQSPDMQAPGLQAPPQMGQPGMQMHADSSGVSYDHHSPNEQALQNMQGEYGMCPHCGVYSFQVDGACQHCGQNVIEPAYSDLGGPDFAPDQHPRRQGATQGPHTPEQISAVQQLLLDTGREQEVPNVPLHPENYTAEMAQIQQVDQPPMPPDDPAPPPSPDPAMAGQPPPGGDPSQQMPMPGMAVSRALAAVLARTAADNVAGRCPKCKSHTTAMISPSGQARCHACGHCFKSKNARRSHDHEQLNPTTLPAADAEQQFDPNAQQDTAHAWKDEMGEQLEPGKQYRVFSEKFAIPDLLRIDQVKPESIEVEETGAYGLNFPHEITWDEAQMQGYTFERADDADSSGLDPSTEPNQDDHHLVDQRVPAGSGEQTDLSSPHMMTSGIIPGLPCRNCGKADQMYHNSAEGITHCQGCGTMAPQIGSDMPRSQQMDVQDYNAFPAAVATPDDTRQLGPVHQGRTAGAEYTQNEQGEFVNERGVARNLDRLSLRGTHYEDTLNDDDYGLFL